MRVNADPDLCIGAGRCQLTAPDLFGSDDDGLVVVRRSDPDEGRRVDVETAARLCPAGAIVIDRA
jgi:ferredoxin